MEKQKGKIFMDKEFMNFLINLDKEKSKSAKVKVNQAYEIYHSIVDSPEDDSSFCFLKTNKEEIEVIPNMTPHDAINFISALADCSSNSVFCGELLLTACGIIVDNYARANNDLKDSFTTRLVKILTIFFNEGILSCKDFSLILGINEESFDLYFDLINAVKKVESND